MLIRTLENSANNTYSVDLVNHGVGLAIIDHALIRYKGQQYRDHLFDIFKAELPGMDSVILEYTC